MEPKLDRRASIRWKRIGAAKSCLWIKTTRFRHHFLPLFQRWMFWSPSENAF